MGDSYFSDASSIIMASDTEGKEYEKQLPKLIIKLSRLEDQMIRRSPRPKKPTSRYSDYNQIISSPVRVKKSLSQTNSVSNNEGRRRRVRLSSSVSSDVMKKQRNRDVSKIDRVEESSEESGEENRPNLVIRKKKVLKIDDYDDDKEDNKKIDGTRERRKRVSVSSSGKDLISNDNELLETPRKSKRAAAIASTSSRRALDLEESEPLTPKKNVLTPKAKTPSTAIRKGLLTPSMQRRNIKVFKPATPLQNARAHLHVSSVPKSLPCREEEFNNIYMFLEGKLMDDIGG